MRRRYPDLRVTLRKVQEAHRDLPVRMMMNRKVVARRRKSSHSSSSRRKKKPPIARNQVHLLQ
jgi:hypothetical protein